MSKFSDEQSCKDYLKDIRMKEGVICEKPGIEGIIDRSKNGNYNVKEWTVKIFNS